MYNVLSIFTFSDFQDYFCNLVIFWKNYIKIRLFSKRIEHLPVFIYPISELLFITPKFNGKIYNKPICKKINSIIHNSERSIGVILYS